MFNINYNPDVLTCLANLSNDEVFTPPHIANQMLDLLPNELWSDKAVTFLDPCCKSGVFLREIAKRLNKGLETEIPNLQERLNHIYTKQLYGIAITELTSLLSRRTLYCSKNANGEFSVCESFDKADGNIRYKNVEHYWKGNKCKHCGATKSVYERGNEHENYAYEFIHRINPEEIFNMKFDVIIGNPPYQLSDGGNGVSAQPIFHLFVEQAKKLEPRFLSMIIPARWYSGGKGLNDFRSKMLNDKRLKILVDFESSKECFDNVNIAGGICYFLWERNYSSICEVVNTRKSKIDKLKRHLNQFPVFIRTNGAISIIQKVLQKTNNTWDKHNYTRNPFGFSTKDRGKSNKFKNSIALLSSKGFGYVRNSDIEKNRDLITKYKILIGRLVPSNGELDVNPEDGYRVITNTKIINPYEIHTESYLLIGAFNDRNKAINFENFIKTKFVRFLIKQAISSVNITKDSFRFVPTEDFSAPILDSDLYKKYGLSNDEIKLIESTIREICINSNSEERDE